MLGASCCVGVRTCVLLLLLMMVVLDSTSLAHFFTFNQKYE